MAHTKESVTSGTTRDQIIETLRAHPNWARIDIARHVGCSVNRVGEAVRYLREVSEKAPVTKRVVVRLPGLGKTSFNFVSHDANTWTARADGMLDVYKLDAVVATYALGCWVGVSVEVAGA